MRPPQTDAAGPVELRPDAMGSQGDAVAEFEGKRVFVPFALPGELLRARLRPRAAGDLAAEAVEILAPSPERIDPACRHFGQCGGCNLQHWAAAPYRAWKLDLVRQALKHHGLEMPARVEAVFLPPASRRRAEFAARKSGGAVSLGFQEARGQRIVDQQECPILAPALARLVAPLRLALAELLAEGQGVDILVTATGTGLDLAIAGERAPTGRQRQSLAAFAANQDVARITWRSGRGSAEPIVQLRPPQVVFGDVAVDLPAPSFLQPSEGGEAALRSAVLGQIGKVKRIAELFAGCGTFTFALAGLGQVHAVEGAKASLQALEQAARRAQVSHRITVERRDLEHAPLTPMELKSFDAVVFDPPRAGAKAQSEQLARAKLRQVIAVSCNPATFARDARLLVDGGFSLGSMVVVDQFVWSPHLELVADFRRAR